MGRVDGGTTQNKGLVDFIGSLENTSESPWRRLRYSTITTAGATSTSTRIDKTTLATRLPALSRFRCVARETDKVN